MYHFKLVKTMKLKYIIIIVALLFSACTKLEDEIFDGLPISEFPEDAAQVAAIPIPTYQALQGMADWSGWWFAQEVTSDCVTAPTRGEHWDDGGKWRVLHQHKWDNQNETINNMWSSFYDGIFEANSALDLLNTFEESENLLIVKAKLKAMRAFYYWQLIDNYGDVPFTFTQIDVPLHPEKVDRATIFTSIVEDLENSLVYIPEISRNTAVSKGMAYSLLAKLYINAEIYTGTANWAKAEEYCTKVEDLTIYSLENDPLSPFVTKNEGSQENIFAIPYDEDDFTGFNLHMRTLHYNNNLTFEMTVGPWNGFAIMENHFNRFTDEDLRKKGLLYGQQYTSAGKEIIDGTTETPLILTPEIPALQMGDAHTEEEKLMSGARVVKFEIAIGAKDNLSNDFPLFRYADVLLMKAEALLRQTKNQSEVDDLVNLVRNRAGLDSWTDVTLEMLLEERARELYWEGHRRQDLIRFGEFNKSWWEKTASTPDRNTFPIPQWAIDGNPNLN